MAVETMFRSIKAVFESKKQGGSYANVDKTRMKLPEILDVIRFYIFL